MAGLLSIKEKLLMIQEALLVPKSQYNEFGKYKFRSCEDILEAVKPLCRLNKCLLTLSDELVNIGNHNYVEAKATLADTESVNVLFAKAFAREALTQKGMNDAQLTGSSSSYARKYALNGLFLIDDTKDDDYINKGDKTPPAPSEASIINSDWENKAVGYIKNKEYGKALNSVIGHPEKLKTVKKLIEEAKKVD